MPELIYETSPIEEFAPLSFGRAVLHLVLIVKVHHRFGKEGALKFFDELPYPFSAVSFGPLPHDVPFDAVHDTSVASAK